MAVPAKPTGGAPIESAWGSIVHDTTVALDIQAGQVAINWAASALSDYPHVVFPRPFAAPPMVVCTVVNPAGSPQPRLVGGVGMVTTTAFDYRGVETRESAATASLFVQWIAIGPRA